MPSVHSAVEALHTVAESGSPSAHDGGSWVPKRCMRACKQGGAVRREAEKKAEVAKLEVAETKALKSQGSGGALGKVSGSASGGKVLEKEEVSADVLNMLKV